MILNQDLLLRRYYHANKLGARWNEVPEYVIYFINYFHYTKQKMSINLYLGAPQRGSIQGRAAHSWEGPLGGARASRHSALTYENNIHVI